MTTDRWREGLPARLRGEWATLTDNEARDTWELRCEAAAEIERLRARVKELEDQANG